MYSNLCIYDTGSLKHCVAEYETVEVEDNGENEHYAINKAWMRGWYKNSCTAETVEDNGNE